MMSIAQALHAQVSMFQREKEKFMSPRAMITDLDRRRLGTVIDRVTQADLRERRYLADLEQELDRAAAVDATEVPPDVVTMNSTVELSDVDSGDTGAYTLVYPDEADIQRNRISVLAPVGTAILGYRVGDVVRWPAPDGVARVRIDNSSLSARARGRLLAVGVP